VKNGEKGIANVAASPFSPFSQGEVPGRAMRGSINVNRWILAAGMA
jgi:hypothetical protein